MNKLFVFLLSMGLVACAAHHPVTVSNLGPTVTVTMNPSPKPMLPICQKNEIKNEKVIIYNCYHSVLAKVPADSDSAPVHGNSLHDSATRAGAQYEGGQCTHCGTERWDVKTLVDPGASKIDSTVKDSSIDTLINFNNAQPHSEYTASEPRHCPDECQTLRIHGNLIGFKMEADQDYHLVIADPYSGNTMIAEIPSSVCDTVCSSGKGAQYDTLRQILDNNFGVPQGSRFNKLQDPVPITIVGIPFFDRIHGQTGVAGNGIEIHPVLQLTLNK